MDQISRIFGHGTCSNTGYRSDNDRISGRYPVDSASGKPDLNSFSMARVSIVADNRDGAIKLGPGPYTSFTENKETKRHLSIEVNYISALREGRAT